MSPPPLAANPLLPAVTLRRPRCGVRMRALNPGASGARIEPERAHEAIDVGRVGASRWPGVGQDDDPAAGQHAEPAHGAAPAIADGADGRVALVRQPLDARPTSARHALGGKVEPAL